MKNDNTYYDVVQNDFDIDDPRIKLIKKPYSEVISYKSNQYSDTTIGKTTLINDPQMMRTYEQIYKAVKRNNIQGVSSLLGSFNQVDAMNPQPIPQLNEVFDMQQNSLLHHTAFNSNFQLFNQIIDHWYTQGNQSSYDLEKWVNSVNEVGISALHLACVRGNYEIVQKIQEMKGDMKIKQHKGMSAMHILAQCDQIKLLVYFKEVLGHDINALDNQNGTPLHQAAFSGSENASFLLLAWGASINLQDSEGFTPLHIACVCGRIRIVKRLLVYGAKTNLIDSRGQTAYQAAIENSQYKIAKILKNQMKISLKSCYGIQTKKSKFQFKRVQQIIFFTIFVLTAFYSVLELYQNDIMSYILMTLILIVFFLWIYLCSSNTKLQKRPKGQFFEVFRENEFQIDEMCLECENISPIRSKHCDLCNACISVYDHHCPWINNCIGSGNHAIFVFFLIAIILTISQIITFILLNFNNNNKEKIKILPIIQNLISLNGFQYIEEYGKYLILVILGLFYFPILILLLYQLQNISKDLTTYERITNEGYNIQNNKKQQNSQSKSIKKISFRNCLNMCILNNRNRQYIYVLDKKSDQLTVE